jgi:hypothetical protein
MVIEATLIFLLFAMIAQHRLDGTSLWRFLFSPDAILVTDPANFTRLKVDFEHVLGGGEQAD